MIDWKRPIELLDGTPVYVSSSQGNMAPGGYRTYGVRREDKEIIVGSLYDATVEPDGTRNSEPFVRNRPVTDEPTETLTISEEDSEVELLHWRIDGLTEKLNEAEARILKADQQHHGYRVSMQAELDHLRGVLGRLTSNMTVAELRRVGVTVTLDYEED